MCTPYIEIYSKKTGKTYQAKRKAPTTHYRYALPKLSIMSKMSSRSSLFFSSP